MTVTPGVFEERAPRYEINQYTDVTVTMTKQDDTQETFDAALIDLSTRGARFKATRSLSVQDVLAIDIDVAASHHRMRVCGEICWVAPASGDTWWLGCRLSPPIPQEALDQFAQARILERRDDPRESISVASTARWELTPDSWPAQILNFSRGGFCLRQPTETMLGERVLMELNREDSQETLVRGKALWQMESPDGFIIGCEFVRPEDFLAFKEIKKSQAVDWHKPVPARRVHAQETQQPAAAAGESRRPRRRRRVFGAIAAAAALVTCIAIGWSVMLALPIGRQVSLVESFDSTASYMAGAHARGSRPEMATAIAQSPTNPTTDWLMPQALDVEKRRITPLEKPIPPRASAPQGGTALAALVASKNETHPSIATAERRHASRRATEAGIARSTPPVVSRKNSTHSPTCLIAAESAPKPPHAGRDLVITALQQCADQFREGNWESAATSLQTAIWHDMTNPEYRFFLAMIRFQQDQMDEAERVLRKAVELEQARPVDAWGEKMQRYQGSARLWLERERARLRSTQPASPRGESPSESD